METIPPAVRQLAERLTAKRQTIAVAEVDTCGLAGYWLSTVPGASRYFPGGVIAYAGSVKSDVLGIPKETLAREGSVSEVIARELARNVRRLVGTDIGVSNTGIAGPTGGTAEKPIGLFYLAISTRDGYERCLRLVFSADRDGNKRQAAQAMLELANEYLEQAR